MYLKFFHFPPSFGTVQKLISALWKSSGVEEDKFINFNTIKKHFLSFGFSVISPIAAFTQTETIKSESLSLSGDHTYKFVKNLTVTEVSKEKVNEEKLIYSFRSMFLPSYFL